MFPFFCNVMCFSETPGMGAVSCAQAAVQKVPSSGNKAQANDQKAKAASEALVVDALSKGSLDNITVIVMLLQWD
jgi:serine/threonine protein phosphatase PrpC